MEHFLYSKDCMKFITFNNTAHCLCLSKSSKIYRSSYKRLRISKALMIFHKKLSGTPKLDNKLH